MAVTATNLETSGSASSASSYATGSVTPLAYELVLVTVYSNKASGNTPTISGNGLTYVQVATIPDSTNTHHVTLFRGLGNNPTAGAITIDFASQAQNRCTWSIDLFDSVDFTGSNGANAVVQSATNKDEGTNTGLTVTLGAFGDVNNATYGAFRLGSTETVGSGFTQLGQYNTADNIMSEWKATNDTSVDATCSSTSGFALGVAAELKFSSTPKPRPGFFSIL